MATGRCHIHARTARSSAGGRKRITGYYAEFREPHRYPVRKRVTLGTSDRREAERRFADLERRYGAGTFDPWTDATPHRDRVRILATEAVRPFVRAKKAEQLRRKSVKLYRSVAEAFVATLPTGLPLAGVEARHVRAFVTASHLAEASQRTYRIALQVFFKWAMDAGHVTHSPAAGVQVQKGRGQKQRPRFLTEADFERLLLSIEAQAALHPASYPDGGRYLSDAFRFAVGTGLRRGELVHLNWNAVDLGNGYVYVRHSTGFTTKSGKERSIPLVGDARAVIQERLQRAERTGGADGEAPVFTNLQGGRLSAQGMASALKRFVRLAGLPDELHFHSLRHTFASWAVLRGMEITRLRDLMGHSSIATTMVYAHLHPQAARADMERAFGNRRGEGHGAGAEQTEAAQLRAEIERMRAELDELRAAA
jgi:integrase/recombinase XerC